jgi:hypothetical protein
MQVSASSKGLTAVHPSIQKLVDSLTSTTDEAALVKSLKSLHTLGKNEKNRQQIFIAGSQGILIDLCQSEKLTVSENAARCLLSLAEGEENSNSIGSLGMDTFLANLGTTHSDVVINSCKLLAKLAQTAENRELIRSRGGLARLVNCLKREHEWIRLYATKALMMAFSDDASALQSAIRDNDLAQVYQHYRAHIEATNIKMDI